MNKPVMVPTSKTDWSKIDPMTDEEIDTSDIPPLAATFFTEAELRMPPPALTTVTLRVDAATVAWFHAQGGDAEQHMADALKLYVEGREKAHKAP